MSLLLDALKKAAEQKAEKSKEEAPQASSSDETVVGGAAAEGASVLDADDSSSRNDETVIDNTSMQSRVEQTRLDSDQMPAEPADTTLTQTPSPSSQMQSGEDETIIFNDEDVSDFMGEPEFIRRDPKGWREGDETPSDQTNIDKTEAKIPDETIIDETEVRIPDETVIDKARAQVPDEVTQYQAEADDTQLDQTEHQAREASDMPPQAADDADMDLTESQTRFDDTQHAVAADQTEHQTNVEATVDHYDDGDSTEMDQTAQQDEDMSLLLVEQEVTDFTGHTSMTDPQSTHEQMQALLGDDNDELGLVDTTRHQMPADDTETGSPTQANTQTVTSVVPDGTASDGTVTRAESTSTRTYAPDNYDRTLMKLPNEDASRIFAGMKSDADVVMTPENAKKVFRSKSSAQRMVSYRLYLGIGVVILLGISIFGAFEFQKQSDMIDSSLRPLKRDPMPGVIRTDSGDQDSNLFAQEVLEVDSRTIDIIESADATSAETLANDEVAEPADEMATETVVGVVTQEVAESEVDSATTTVAAEATAADEIESSSMEVASIPGAETATEQTQGDPANLQISSSSRFEQKQLMLQEAYAAYESGDNETALARYNEVLEVDPGNRNALLARAAINVQNDNSAAAVDDYQSLLLANPKDSLAMTSLLSVTSFSPTETESRLKLMIRDEPDSPYLNFALANAYGAQNRWREAQGHYFKALQNNPRDPNYAYNLAVSLEHISQPRSAMTYYQRALDNFGNGLATFSRNVVDQRLAVLGNL